MYNILVTGSNGQLGSEIRLIAESYPQYYFFFTDADTLDITDKKTTRLFVQENKITAIINCAAYTAVDKAETEEELADQINHKAVKYLAIVAKENHCKLIHISTDYVFDGTKTIPYTEDDIPNPQSIYGKTKLAGDLTLQLINPENSIIIRTSWVYATFGNNFVKTMLRLGQVQTEINIVADQLGTPTYARDLAQTILQIIPKIENKTVEVFNYSNEGVCSWADFGTEIFKIANINCSVKPISTDEYPTPAKRPKYSVMEKLKIKEVFGVKIPTWEVSLLDFLRK